MPESYLHDEFLVVLRRTSRNDGRVLVGKIACFDVTELSVVTRLRTKKIMQKRMELESLSELCRALRKSVTKACGSWF